VQRIARAALDFAGMTPPIERQEESLLTCQPRGHVDFVGVGGKMHQRPAFELEQWCARVAIYLVLLHRMTPALARARILQLARRHRQAVDGENHVHCAVIIRMTRHLSGDRKKILLVQRQHVEVQAVRRFEMRQPECLPIKLEAVP
jgi:hypothetical protein